LFARNADCEAAVLLSKTRSNSPPAFSGRRLPFGKAFFEVARGDGRRGFHLPKADEIWGGYPFCRFQFSKCFAFWKLKNVNNASSALAR
jgi:hypothetical protein